MKAIFYVKKEKPYLFNQNVYEFYESKYITSNLKQHKDYNYILNGKIIAECDFEVEEIFEDNLEDARDGYVEHFYTLKSYDDFDEGENVLLKESCLQKHELSNYLGFENGYAIHISNLNVFDKPKELKDYSRRLLGRIPDGDFQVLGNAPKNMMKCCEIKYMVEDYILISITSQEACNILNHKQDVLVRRNVLKEMLKNE